MASRATGNNRPLSPKSLDSGDEDQGSVSSLYHDALEVEDPSASMTAAQLLREKRLNSKRRFVRLRQRAGDMVNNSKVQLFIIALIIANTILMAIATFDFVTDNPKVEGAFEAVDLVFLSVFTLELAVQFFYHGIKLFQDGWLVFDFVIILLSWSFYKFQIIRAFRIFRAFRLVTRVKVFRDLVNAIVAVLPRMTAIGALLLLVFYVYSVLFVELFGELELSDNYFKTLDASLFTCFQMMTMEWADIARECQETYSYAPFVFVSFIMITGFIVFNLIIAVVCDAVAFMEDTSRDLDEDAEQIAEEKLCLVDQRIQILGSRMSGLMDRQKGLNNMLDELESEIRVLEESKQ